MKPSRLLAVLLVLTGMAYGADAQTQDGPVTLSVNPDGTVVWNGERLANKPALENRLARRAQQAPRLELDLNFHSADFSTDSNRKTLLDLLEMTARFGYVHVESYGGGARLIVLGPSAADSGR